MTAYRKRPVEVAAFCTSDPWPAWGVNLLTREVVRPGPVGVCDWTIDTLEGPMRVKAGDWIVLGVEGEVYAVKPSIFAKTYEPVGAGEVHRTDEEEVAVTLAECPVGLFWCGDELCLKTEYGNNEGRIDAFTVSSGEFFWGDAPQTIASQRAQKVVPVATDAALNAIRGGE